MVFTLMRSAQFDQSVDQSLWWGAGRGYKDTHLIIQSDKTCSEIEKEVFLKLILKEQDIVNQVNKGGNVTGIGT